MQSTPENSGPFQKIISLLKGEKKQSPVQDVETSNPQLSEVSVKEIKIPDYLKVSNAPKVPITPGALWGNAAQVQKEEQET